MKNYLPFREKIAYGFGDLASVLYWQTFMLYFTFFYTDVFLIPAAAAATMFLVSRLIDGFSDPLMGIIADKTNTRWGKFRPYLLWFCVPFAIVGVLTFTVPDFGIQGKMIWAYATFFLIMLLYTIINIPYTSLLGVISPNSSERTTVSSVKFIFAFAAGIIISATLLPMTQYLGKNDTSIMEASIDLKGENIIVQEQRRGVSTFLITAKDNVGNATLHEVRFTVSPTENNVPRVVNEPVDLGLQSGFNTYSFSIADVFKGSEHQNFTYSVFNSNTDLVEVSLSETTLFVREKAQSQSGTAYISLQAHDERWGSSSVDFAIDVVAPNNSIPYVVQDAPEKMVLNFGFNTKEVQLSDFFIDDNNDALTYSVTLDKETVLDAFVNGDVLVLSEINTGVTTIDITAKDNKGGRAVHSMKYFVVTPGVNNPPFVVTNQTSFDVSEGFDSYSIPLSNIFYDVEGDHIQYEMVVVNEAKGWSRFFMIIGVAAVIFFLIAFKGTKERIKPPTAQKTNVVRDLKQLITNGPWLILLAATITFILFVAVRGSVTVHYFKYIIGHQVVNVPFFGEKTYDFTVLTSAYNTIGQLSALVGVFAVGWLAKLFGKIKIFIAFFVIAIISTAGVFLLTAENLGLIYFLQFTGSFTGGPLSVLLWAMYADVADYSEWKNGRRATGLIFSASTMSQKIGWAVGAFVALTLMSQVGFEPNQLQTEESTRGLLALFTLIPAGIGIVSILIILFYPLNDSRVKVMEGELMTRREKE